MSKHQNSGQITTLSVGTIITGDIVVENDIRIAGTVKGKITTVAHLILEQTGKIEGEIKAKRATLAGRVEGNIEVEETLILESKASLSGDLKTRLLTIEEGAYFNGNSATNSKIENKKIPNSL
ncbi:MAG: polymer-forming cytoskeletal protein [Fibrobacter sp.]|nr:polymer-forming cytoskeletal protein [Fibrobacter sp.]